jgi:photosystem II PsbX protein
MTATLSNFLWSIFWGGALVAAGAAALTLVARIDRIR